MIAARSPSSPHGFCTLKVGRANAHVTRKGQLKHLSLAQVASEDPPGKPNVTWPTDYTWITDKPPVKQSIKDTENEGTIASASPWVLNITELLHWVSFPIGFLVLWQIFSNVDVLTAYLNRSENAVPFLFLAAEYKTGLLRIFCMILGLVSQVYGGGISGNMMHEYEGWQVAPFRSPLEEGRTDAYPVSSYNNAWLRAVAYEMLFTFQTFGLLIFSVGVCGLNWLTLALAVPFLASFVYKGKRWSLTLDKKAKNGFIRTLSKWLKAEDHSPIFPLPVPLLAVFIPTAFVNSVSYIHLFGAAMAKAWPPTLFPFLPAAPAWLPIGGLLAVLGPLLVAAGGIYEGVSAESNFNQWNHFWAFTLLDLGLGYIGLLFWHLASYAPTAPLRLV